MSALLLRYFVQRDTLREGEGHFSITDVYPLFGAECCLAILRMRR